MNILSSLHADRTDRDSVCGLKTSTGPVRRITLLNPEGGGCSADSKRVWDGINDMLFLSADRNRLE